MKVLLLPPVPPCSQFTGGILTESMCRFLPEGSLTCFAPTAIPLDGITIADDLASMPLASAVPPHDNTLHVLGGRATPYTFLHGLYTRATDFRRLVDQVVDYGREHNIDRVWCILQGQTLIRLARAVSERLDVPLFTQVWDYPEYWIRLNRLDPISARLLLREYRAVMAHSTCCAAASPEMAEEVRKDYGIKAVSIVGSLDKRLAVQPDETIAEPEHEYTIGMAGQLYADGAWRAMLAALDKADWRLNGRNVRVRYLGYNMPFPADVGVLRHGRACLEYLGFRPQAEVVKILSTCHMLYVPFFSGPDFATLAATSFPAKIATYFAAGRPVFVHGPEYSPPSRFVHRTDTGVTCDSACPDAIIESLEELVSDHERYKARMMNTHRAFLEHLSLERLEETFLEFISAT